MLAQVQVGACLQAPFTLDVASPMLQLVAACCTPRGTPYLLPPPAPSPRPLPAQERDPHQPEFLAAVKEVATALQVGRWANRKGIANQPQLQGGRAPLGCRA